MVAEAPAAEGSGEPGSGPGGIQISSTPALLRLVVWGYWPPEVVTAFALETATLCQKLMPVGSFVLDAAQLKPQGAEGQAALRGLFRSLSEVSFARGTIIAENALTKMQLARLVRESGLQGRVEFSDASP